MSADLTGGTPAPPERRMRFEARRTIGAAGRTAAYSSFVGVMRYALPLVALVLLGLIVAWPLVTGREEGFRISFTDSTDVDGSLRMINARYLGTDDRKQPYTVTADLARQPDPESPIVFLDMINADVFTMDDEWYALTADTGRYDREGRLLDLDGNVTIHADDGTEFRTDRAHADLGTGTAEGDRPVEGQGPLGQLNAEAFRIIEGGESLFFSGNVRLVIDPKAKEAK